MIRIAVLLSGRLIIKNLKGSGNNLRRDPLEILKMAPKTLIIGISKRQ